MSKRALILTSDAGLGHRKAAEAIEEVLLSRQAGWTAEIVNPMSDPDTPALLQRSQTDYDTVVKELPEMYKLGYEASDATLPSALIETALTLTLFESVSKEIEHHSPDIIVATYPLYQAPLRAINTVRQTTIPFLTVVTDLTHIHRIWFHRATTLCTVPTEQAHQQAIEQALTKEQVRLTGIPVDPAIAKEDRPKAEIRTELGWKPDRMTALVVGSKRVQHLTELLTPLNHSGHPIQLALVAGGNDELYSRLRETKWHLPTHAYNFVDNMPTLMQASDLILCKAGGLIVSESLACGLPMILIDALPGQEMGNATYVVEEGAGKRAETPLAVLETIRHWLEDDAALLKTRAQNAARIGHPHAADEIVGQIIRIAEQHTDKPGPSSDEGRSELVTLLDRFGISWRPGETRSSGGGL